MRAWRVVPVLLVMVLSACARTAEASVTGILEGIVVTHEGGAPIRGAEVTLARSGLSIDTDARGAFRFPIVASGAHRIHVRGADGGGEASGEVFVWPDRVNAFRLVLVARDSDSKPWALTIEPRDSRGVTSTVRLVSREALRRGSARGFDEAAALHAGVDRTRWSPLVDESATPSLLIRGGAPHETGWRLDGGPPSQTTHFTGGSIPPLDALDGVAIAPIGFQAKYGGTTGGIVHWIPRDGGSEGASFEASALSDAASGEWSSSRRFERDHYAATLRGAVGDQALAWLVSGERRWLGDRAPGYVIDRGLAREAGAFGPAAFEEGRQPANTLGGWSGLASLRWRPVEGATLRAGAVGTADNWRKFVPAYLFNLEHSPRQRDRRLQGFAALDWTPSPTTSWSLSAGISRDELRFGDGVHFDDLRSYARPGNPSFDIPLSQFWMPGHVFDLYVRELLENRTVMASMTHQLAASHRVEGGIEVQRATHRVYLTRDPVHFQYDSSGALIYGTFEGYGYDSLGNEEVNGGFGGARHPTQFATWLQDRFERGPVTIDAGLRLESFEADPRSLDPVMQEPVGSRRHTSLSPRFGLSVDLARGSALRTSVGRFVQPLPYPLDLFGAKPERAFATEVGWTGRLDDRGHVDASAFYKRIADYLEIDPPVEPGHREPLPVPLISLADPATIMGLELECSARWRRRLSLMASYTLARTEGEFTATGRNIPWEGPAAPRFVRPLDFDRTHRAAADVVWHWGPSEGPRFRGATPLADTELELLVRAASGTPYTPTAIYDEVTLAAVSPVPIDAQNSARTPAMWALDLRIGKQLRVGSLRLESALTVLNVFDRRNAHTVYSGTGSATTTGYLETEGGRAWLEAMASQGLDGPTLYRLAESRAGFFDTARTIRLEVRAGL